MKRYRGENPSFTKHKRSPYSRVYPYQPMKRAGVQLKRRIAAVRANPEPFLARAPESLRPWLKLFWGIA